MALAHKGVQFVEDHVAVLEGLLKRAKAGELIGVAYMAESTSKEFEIGFAGTVLDRPLQTLGILEFMRLDFAHGIRRQLRVVHP